MSFFKEFKDDLSQAVNELMPGEDELEDIEPVDSTADTGTVSNDVDVESELLKLDGLLEKVSKEAEEVPMPEDDLDAAPVPEDEPVQLSLFDFPAPRSEKQQKLDAALDNIRAKYGKDAIKRGRFL